MMRRLTRATFALQLAKGLGSHCLSSVQACVCSCVASHASRPASWQTVKHVQRPVPGPGGVWCRQAWCSTPTSELVDADGVCAPALRLWNL